MYWVLKLLFSQQGHNFTAVIIKRDKPHADKLLEIRLDHVHQPGEAAVKRVKQPPKLNHGEICRAPCKCIKRIWRPVTASLFSSQRGLIGQGIAEQQCTSPSWVTCAVRKGLWIERNNDGSAILTKMNCKTGKVIPPVQGLVLLPFPGTMEV